MGLNTTHAPACQQHSAVRGSGTAAGRHEQAGSTQPSQTPHHASSIDGASRACIAGRRARRKAAQTARTTTDARSEPHAALRDNIASTTGHRIRQPRLAQPWKAALYSQAAHQTAFPSTPAQRATRRTHAAHGRIHTVLDAIEQQQRRRRTSRTWRDGGPS